MHVTAHVTHYYHHEPVPPGFDTTTDEFKSALKTGLAKVAAHGGHVVRVKRKLDTHIDVKMGELEIMQWMLHKSLPQYGGVVLTRKEAVADYFAVRVLPEHAHPTHLARFEVHDDGTPSETSFRTFLEPYTKAIDARSGELIVPPETLERLVKAYLDPCDAGAHVDHLHAKFNLPKPAEVAK
jgi:hypothetical protein